MFKKRIRTDKLPQHIAFIMDGNGRWAKERLLPRSAGHTAGVYALKRVIQSAYELGIRCVTFYAFSTENWKRPKEEIDALFDIFRNFLRENREEYLKKDIKLVILGDMSRFPDDIRRQVEEFGEKTKDCGRLAVSIAFNYGSRDEIMMAARKLCQNGLEFTEENFRRCLYTRDIPDPDIIVRTSGEMRLSNFLLYQAAYSELFFVKKYWPDFGYNDLVDIINRFSKRNRRFGSV
jgi:undecaprenyl diphosphate synthase